MSSPQFEGAFVIGTNHAIERYRQRVHPEAGFYGMVLVAASGRKVDKVEANLLTRGRCMTTSKCNSPTYIHAMAENGKFALFVCSVIFGKYRGVTKKKCVLLTVLEARESAEEDAA